LNKNLHRLVVPVQNLMRFSMSVTSNHRNRSKQA